MSDTSADNLIAFAGTPNTTITEAFDGVSWTEVADLSVGRQELSGCGTGDIALKFSGAAPPGVSTEEWTKAQNIKVIDD